MRLPKYRAAILGAGWIGTGYSPNSPTRKPDNHQDGYRANPQIDYLGAFDKGDTVPPCDILSICTPPETHKELVCVYAPVVDAILCEKPMAMTVDDADAMIAACLQHGTLLVVNYQRHFTSPVFRWSRDGAGHAMDLIQDVYGPVLKLLPDKAICARGIVRLEYVDTTGKPWEDAHIFEFDLTHNNDSMIPGVIDHIVNCLDTGYFISNASQARESLRLEIEWKELRTRSLMTA